MLWMLKTAGSVCQHSAHFATQVTCCGISCARAKELMFNTSWGRDDTDKWEVYQKLGSMKYYFHVVNLPISKLIRYQYRPHTYVDKARKLIPEFTCCLSHWALTSYRSGNPSALKAHCHPLWELSFTDTSKWRVKFTVCILFTWKNGTFHCTSLYMDLLWIMYHRKEEKNEELYKVLALFPSFTSPILLWSDVYRISSKE